MNKYMNMSAIELSYLPADELTEAWKNGYLTWDKMSQAEDIRWERTKLNHRQQNARIAIQQAEQANRIAMQNAQIAMQQAENANRVALDMHQQAVDAANQAVQLHNIMFNMF